MKYKLAIPLARAAAYDHGNRHARHHGRAMWTEDDWNAACQKFDELLRAEESVEDSVAPSPGGYGAPG